MKRSIVFGVLFSTALAAGASAQSTGGQPPSQSGSSDQVTVTGCLLSGGATGIQEHRAPVLRAPVRQVPVRQVLRVRAPREQLKAAFS